MIYKSFTVHEWQDRFLTLLRSVRSKVFLNFLRAKVVERLTRHFDTQYITLILFIYLYYVYNICVSKLVDPGEFPFSRHGAIHHTTFFIKLIFFKKSHLRYLERLLSLATRKSARGERKIHLALKGKMDMKIFMLKVIYVRASRHRYDLTSFLL